MLDDHTRFHRPHQILCNTSLALPCAYALPTVRFLSNSLYPCEHGEHSGASYMVSTQISSLWAWAPSSLLAPPYLLLQGPFGLFFFICYFYFVLLFILIFIKYKSIKYKNIFFIFFNEKTKKIKLKNIIWYY